MGFACVVLHLPTRTPEGVGESHPLPLGISLRLLKVLPSDRVCLFSASSHQCVCRKLDCMSIGLQSVSPCAFASETGHRGVIHRPRKPPQTACPGRCAVVHGPWVGAMDENHVGLEGCRLYTVSCARGTGRLKHCSHPVFRGLGAKPLAPRPHVVTLLPSPVWNNSPGVAMGRNKCSACSMAPLVEEEPRALAAAAGMSRAPSLHRSSLLLPGR